MSMTDILFEKDGCIPVWENLTLNVIGGILAGWAFAVWHIAVKALSKYRFKQIFGFKASDEGITLVYEELASLVQGDKFIYCKPGDEASGRRLSISRPIPIASVRAVSYLSNAIGKFIRRSPAVRSDTEVRSLLDFDFICFGGPFSNAMTQTCLENAGNRLVTFDQTINQFKRKNDTQALVNFVSGFDYGLILKLHPVQFPERVWILCAGIGERGTSGAAWFLANKWKEIWKRTSDNPFAAILKVEGDVHSGRDQSAELLKLIVLHGERIETTSSENSQ